MNKVVHPKLESTLRLEKFYKYLNYEINTSWFLPIAWLMYLMFGNNGVAIIGLILSAVAIIFTPFLIYVLFKEGKFGWLITFVILVILPALVVITFLFKYLIIAMLPFYLFCFLIRMETKGWISEMRARNNLVLQKIKRANEGVALEDWTVMR